MPAPTWDQYMAPALQVLLDGEVRRSLQIIEGAADILGVTPEQRKILIPPGQQQWINRGNWALSYLSRAGAADRLSRGHYRITDVGRKLLAEHPDRITEKHLRGLSGYPGKSRGKAFSASSASFAIEAEAETALDPAEQIASEVARIHADVADQLLTRLLDQEPGIFEQAVLDLLMAMGYGGAEGVATRTQLSNYQGVDGIIDQDALGLSRIYVQAKRYGPDNAVGREAIQAFVGALAGHRHTRGCSSRPAASLRRQSTMRRPSPPG